MDILIPLLGFAFSLSLITFIIIYSFADKIILRWYRARKVEDGKLNTILRAIATKANISTPRLYAMESSTPNIFSIGRNPENASIVVTTAAMKLLDREELECVFAHEIFHVKNGETPISTLAAVFAGMLTAFATLALWCSVALGFGQTSDPAPRIIRALAMSLVAPHAALIVQLTLPKSREYAADEYSARLCKKPQKLVNALKKIDKLKSQINPSHAHLFIISPLNDELFNSLFNTHPPTNERVKRLKELRS